MLQEYFRCPQSSHTACADLLKIKQLQLSLKFHISNLMEPQEVADQLQFGEKEVLNSRSTFQKQLRFTKIPKKGTAARRLRAPLPAQASALTEQLLNEAGSSPTDKNADKNVNAGADACEGDFLSFFSLNFCLCLSKKSSFQFIFFVSQKR